MGGKALAGRVEVKDGWDFISLAFRFEAKSIAFFLHPDVSGLSPLHKAYWPRELPRRGRPLSKRAASQPYGRHKCPQSKRAILFREIAPAFRIFEDLVRHPDHNYSPLRSYSGRTSLARRIAYPVIAFRCKSVSVPYPASQFPECSSESRFGSPCGSPHRFPCGSRLRCSSKFRCRFSSEPRSRFSFRRSFRSSLASSASGSVGDPFPGLLRTPLPALQWLLSTLSFWRIAPPLN